MERTTEPLYIGRHAECGGEVWRSMCVVACAKCKAGWIELIPEPLDSKPPEKIAAGMPAGPFSDGDKAPPGETPRGGARR